MMMPMMGQNDGCQIIHKFLSLAIQTWFHCRRPNFEMPL